MKNREAIIIPGVYKSGTSTLYNAIINHSRISDSYLKETNFFLLPESLIKKNNEWFNKIFKEKEKIILDATTSYLYNKKTPGRIKKYFEKEPKTIIIIRDPAKRTYSHYMDKQKQPILPDKRSYDEILKEMKGKTKEKIILSEIKSIKKAVKNKKIPLHNKNTRGIHSLSEVKPFYIKFKDYIKKKEGEKVPNKFHRGLYYFQKSLYSKYTLLWEERFKDVKIVLFEELIKNPEKELKKIYKFLGLKPEKKALKLPHSNKTILPNKFGRIVKRYIKLIIPRSIIKILGRILPRKLLYKPKPKMTREQYNKTRKILKKEYEYWNKKKPKTKKLWKHSLNKF